MIRKKNGLKEIVFPLGGIGSGCIGLRGDGRFTDWEIFNRPAKGSTQGYSHLACAVSVGGRRDARVLNGDLTKDLIGQLPGHGCSGYGFGAEMATLAGFPHFRDVTFRGEFPIAELTFSDPGFPGKVRLTAFNPMIPHNVRDSAIPAAFFDVCYLNDTDREVTFDGVLSLSSPYGVSVNRKFADGKTVGVTLENGATADPNEIGYGNMTVLCDAEDSFAQEYWFRGKWQDSLVTYYRELSAGTLRDRAYPDPGRHDTASVGGRLTVPAGEKRSMRFLLSWYHPVCYNYWHPEKGEDGRDLTWKNRYATWYASSAEAALYAAKNYDRLYRETDLFRKSLHRASLDSAVVDAAAGNLAVLKSPTVLLLENGEFYGWEGCGPSYGSCEGSCQHVWNYAYALCFLYPSLERSMRDLEVKYSLHPDGRCAFRLLLPLGTGERTFSRACVDGQMGTVVKIFREWKISGDDAWLRGKWDAVKRMMNYAWSDENPDRWDHDRDGVLEGRQHHTLDMELFGPSSWLQGFYLAALSACAEMGRYLGDTAFASECAELYRKGCGFCRDHLFNGKYFYHRIDLRDRSPVDRFDCADTYLNPESGEIKYQIGEGCEIDQMVGQWHTNLCGLPKIFDEVQTDRALESLYRYNFKPNMRDFVNPWRIFALNDESGTVMCEYPEGVEKPTIPVPYCEECMTGFEYALAGLMASEGKISHALDLVRAVRDRYDGVRRNPYNEIECGSNYARSMASFALIPIFSGFSFDLPAKRIGFDPIEGRKQFRAPWSVGNGWGEVFLKRGDENRLGIVLHGGSITLREIGLPKDFCATKVRIDGKPVRATFDTGKVRFDTATVVHSVEIR